MTRTKSFALLAYTAMTILHQQCQAFQSCKQHHQLSVSSRVSTSKASNPYANSKLNLFEDKSHRDEEERLRPNIHVIQKHDDFVKFLEEDDRLCIVKFYASWCKSCQKFGTKYRKLAYDEGDQLNAEGSITQLGNVRFAEVEYTANAQLCKSLKVRKLPTVHMYRKGKGKISDMTCRPSNFQDVVDEMNRLLLLNDSDEEIRLEESSTVHGDSAVATTPELPFFAVMTEKKKTNNGKIEESTEASFDETMKAGSNLADGILKEVQKKTEKSKIKEGAKEKSPWFPFTF